MKRKEIRALYDDGWKPTTMYRLRRDGMVRTITVTEIKDDSRCTLYTFYAPPKPRTMSPVAYYRKYECVPARYADKTNGRYYCNPAHCSRSWVSKERRDEHLDMAYGLLS